MNVNNDALTQALQLATLSGKVESKRLARAVELIGRINHTFTGTYTDGSHMDEYWIPGSVNRGYSITVRNYRIVGACQCKDHKNRKPIICAHRAAVMLITRAMKLTYEAAPSVPMTIPVTDNAYRRKMLNAMFGPD